MSLNLEGGVVRVQDVQMGRQDVQMTPWPTAVTSPGMIFPQRHEGHRKQGHER